MNWWFTEKEIKTVHTKLLIIIYNKTNSVSFITLIWRFLHLAKLKCLTTHCHSKNVGKQISSYIDGGRVNCPLEDDLAIPIKITKDISFDPASPLLGIYIVHGGTDIYFLYWYGVIFPYTLLSEKCKVQNRIYGYTIMHTIYLKNTQELNLGEGTQWLEDTDGKEAFHYVSFLYFVFLTTRKYYLFNEYLLYRLHHLSY